MDHLVALHHTGFIVANADAGILKRGRDGIITGA
jgi:hypothetical protein